MQKIMNKSFYLPLKTYSTHAYLVRQTHTSLPVLLINTPTGYIYTSACADRQRQVLAIVRSDLSWEKDRDLSLTSIDISSQVNSCFTLDQIADP